MERSGEVSRRRGGGVGRGMMKGVDCMCVIEAREMMLALGDKEEWKNEVMVRSDWDGNPHRRYDDQLGKNTPCLQGLIILEACLDQTDLNPLCHIITVR